MITRIVEDFVNNYCEKYNLILINIHEKFFERKNFNGDKFNDLYYIMDCMNDENKFIKFKITEKPILINGVLYDKLECLRI